MNAAVGSMMDWTRNVWRAWDRFWFTPAQPHTLAAIRICGGLMLLYTHAVWTIDLVDFLGPHSWLTPDAIAAMNRGLGQGSYAWSYLNWIESPALLWTVHLAALVVFLLLTLGLFTRGMAVLAWVITMSYCHRLNGTLFGLDQINAFIATYLMFGDSGGVWSLDRWLARRRGEETSVRPAVGTNIAIRLLQLHMCVIYLFGGIGKMRGDMWWDGSALWFAFATLEYQSLDMTWTVHHRWLLALFTHITVFWETFYCFLVWPKLTRPIALGLAVGVHLGIAVCLGMKTFGLVMIIGNLAFLYPETVRDVVAGVSRLFVRNRTAVGVQPEAAGRRQALMTAAR